MNIAGLSVSEGDLLVRLVWKNSLAPGEAQNLFSDINARVTLSIATFELKVAGVNRAVAVFRGMHFNLSDARKSKALLKEFVNKANEIAAAYKTSLKVENIFRKN
ncbi:MAG: hypothetical protein NTU54_03425 [Candidatus Omnitrophica bacterium]|nr:hypothetical protein [Candidatus Omnitrophota bacterium]